VLLERLQVVVGPPQMLDTAGLQQRLDAKLELLLRDRLALGAFLLWIAAVLFVVYRRW